MKNKKSLTLIGLLAVTLTAGLIVSQEALAVPPGAPPSPNAPDATFSFVTAQNGAQVFADSPNWGFTVINNNTTDGKGAVMGTSLSPTGTGIYGQNISTGYGVYGLGNDGAGVLGHSDNGYGIFGNAENGAGTAGYATTGYGIFGTSNSGTGVYGLSQNSAGSGGKFYNSVSGKLVELAKGAFGMISTGNIATTAGGTVYSRYISGGAYDSATGNIQDSTLSIIGRPLLSLSGDPIVLNGTLASSSPNSVTIKDPQGLMMQNYTTGIDSLNITQDGELGNLTANPVTFRDDDGIIVKNYFATNTLMSLDGSGNFTIPGNANIGGPTYTGNKLNIGGSNNTLRLNGTGSYSSGGKINFGDGENAYIQEDLDDHLKVYARSGVNIESPLLVNKTTCGAGCIIGKFNGSKPTTIYGDGWMGVGNNAPAYNLDVTGTGRVTGSMTAASWNTSSDSRLKDIKGDFDRGLKELLKLQPIVFKYKQDNAEGLDSTNTHYGFSAQAVQKVIPEAVQTDNQGYLSVEIMPFLTTFVNSFKEINSKVENWTAKVEALNSQVSELQKENSDLKIRLEKLEARFK